MLTATLSVTPSEETLDLTLTVENEGDDAVELQFGDGQRADFAAYDVDSSDEVWRWSEGRLFAQVLGTEELTPGESVAYEATWERPPSGTYRVESELVARERSPSAEMIVEL